MAELTEAPQPTDDLQPASPVPPVPVAPPALAAPAAPVKPKRDWGRTAARQASVVSSKLAPLAPLARGAGERIVCASPMTLLLSLLGMLTALAVVASVSFDSSLGVTSAVLFVPLLSAGLGALVMRTLAERRQSQALGERTRDETVRLRQVEHALDYVDTKLATALTQFGTDRHNDAVIAMFQAKAATELCTESVAVGKDSDARTDSSGYRLSNFAAPNALRQTERAAGLSLI